jgi:putative mRNA 3-end processing factor
VFTEAAYLMPKTPPSSTARPSSLEMPDTLEMSPAGLFCPAGGFHIDPWRPVPSAVITHAHADHARSGCGKYLCLSTGKRVLRERVGAAAEIATLRPGEAIHIGGVKLKLVPSGHILGAAQICINHRGVRWVVTGDYKLEADPTCAAFETAEADVLITESTFGLPIYRWGDPQDTADAINTWWRASRDAGRTCVLFAYALGKAQRLAAMLDPSIGPIYAHGAVMKMVRAYRDSGVRLPAIDQLAPATRRAGGGRSMVIAPPSAAGSRWLRTFGETNVAMASGWMAIRGVRRRRGFDRGFVLSDHADFPGLVQAVEASGARRVYVTHGSATSFARFLCERGIHATELATRFTGEEGSDETGDDAQPEAEHRQPAEQGEAP